MTIESTSDALVRLYYDHLNARQLTDAAALFAPDAVVQHLLFEPMAGPEGFMEFACHWHRAFPDVQMTIQAVDHRGPSMCEVDVMATGTHLGTLDMGVYRFRPTAAATSIHLRHLFEVRNERIVFSSLSFDLHDFLQRLVPVDLPALKEHLGNISHLGQALTQVEGEARDLRQLLQQLGAELDAARKVLRPYFYR